MCRYIWVLLLTFAFGCTKVHRASDRCVGSIVKNRIGKEVYWNQDICWDDPFQWTVNSLLEKELSVDSAVQIAIFNNPEIQAVFEDIGIAHADLVQAGLFQNPIFEGYIRFPNKPLPLNTAFSIAQNFIDIFMIPLRQKVAAAELQAAQLRVANAVLDLSFDVEETFYSLVAAQKKLRLMKSLVESTDAARELALSQRDQGNINDLELQSRINEYLEAKIALAESRKELLRYREEMNRLLGLSCSQLCWRINQVFPCMPDQELPVQCLESVALLRRLDIQIVRWEIERLARMGATKHWWSYANPSIGVSTEKDPDGFNVTGPTFSTTLPIFNYGQADRARICAMYKQSLSRLRALEVQVASEVRLARGELMIHRGLVFDYQRELIPLQERGVAMSQRFYNAMALSVYKLLNAKSQELRMEIDYVITLRDYWISKVNLDRALGGHLRYAQTNFCPISCEEAYCENEGVLE